MQIVDAQVHISAANSAERPWPALGRSEPHRPEPTSAADLLAEMDAFGPRRMFWGTDLTRLPCSYRQGITFFTEELAFLSESDKERVMGRGLCEWLGWQ